MSICSTFIVPSEVQEIQVRHKIARASCSRFAGGNRPCLRDFFYSCALSIADGLGSHLEQPCVQRFGPLVPTVLGSYGSALIGGAAPAPEKRFVDRPLP